MSVTLKAAQPQLVLFYEDNYNFLSKMCLERMRRACCEMIARARRSGARVIAAGSDASDAPEAYLDAGADAVLHGEGLAALVALVSRLDGDTAIPVPEWVAGLPDVSHRRRVRARNRDAAPRCRCPSCRSVPAWDLVDIERYRARVARRAWLLQPQHGRVARLLVPVQLVREAHLGQSIPAAHGRATWPRRCCI